MIALDSETCLIEKGNQAPELVCLSWAEGKSSGIYDQYAAGRHALSYSLKKRIVGANIGFDMCVFAANFPELLPDIIRAYDEHRITDVLIREKMIHAAEGCYRGYWDKKFIRFNYSLADVAKRHLDRDLDKTTWRTGYADLRFTPIERWPEGARKYAIDDAIATLDVWQSQEDDKEYLEDQYRQAKADFALKLASTWGITTDPDRVREFVNATKARELELLEVLQKSRLVREDGSRNTKAAATRLMIAYAAKGLSAPRTEPSKKFPEGQVKLDEDTCKDAEDPVLTAYGEYNSIKKIISTDVPILESGLIHTHFDVYLKTGRTGSSSPNIQNIRTLPGIRECFVPRKNFVFAIADYGSLELHTLAQACLDLVGYSRLAEVLNSGLSPHTTVAASILGCSYAECEARVKAKDDEAVKARNAAKVLNFGSPGGIGATRFVEFAKGKGVILTEYQARKLKEDWLRAWPEMVDYFQYMSRASDGERLEFLRSKRFMGDATYTECCNCTFQGLGADLAKDALWSVQRACYGEPESVLFGSRTVNFVHDEIILEAPEPIGHECALELARLMHEAGKKWCPDTPPHAEPLLARCWSKNAKPLYDEKGRLVPWTI